MKSNAHVLLVMVAVFTFSILMQPCYTQAQEEVIKAAGCKTEFFLLKDLAEAYKEKTGNKLQLGNTGNKKAVNLLLDQ